MSKYTIKTIDRLRTRLHEALPGCRAHEKMMGRVVPMPATIPGNAKPSAVLCLLFPIDGELNILLMKRMEDKTAHSGQVSFPGGSYEITDANLKATALRETEEEVGVSCSQIEVLGALTPLYIPVSNFQVYPYVGYTEKKPTYFLNHNEVARTLEIPLANLFARERKTKKDVISPAAKIVIPNVNAYELEDNTVIWGATAMIISELETILNEIH